jgi:hypothetical protein
MKACWVNIDYNALSEEVLSGISGADERAAEI